MCTCLEIGSNPKEAIPYGQKAISVCKSRVQRLTNEIMISTGLASSSAASELGDSEQLSKGSQTVLSVKVKETEIDNIVGLAEDLEKKASAILMIYLREVA